MVASLCLCSHSAFLRRPQLPRSASRQQRAPGQREACIAHISSSNPSVSTERTELEALARDILNKENEIKNAFQPGRAMPTGSQVAAMRNKVKVLRDTLASRVEASSTASDSISTNKEISSLITAVAANQARESMNAMNAQVQNTTSNLILDNGAMLSEKEILELEMLQLENEQLRAKASALLMRQHFLEELMQENDLAVAIPQPPAEPENTNGSSGYYMSSPSYY